MHQDDKFQSESEYDCGGGRHQQPRSGGLFSIPPRADSDAMIALRHVQRRPAS